MGEGSGNLNRVPLPIAGVKLILIYHPGPHGGEGGPQPALSPAGAGRVRGLHPGVVKNPG